MNHGSNTWFLSIAAACAMASTSLATAQTCAAPGAWTPDITGAPPIVANLCALPDSVSLYCDIADSADKNDAIYQVTYAAGFTSTSISISGSAAGFNPVIFLYNAACASGSGCVASGDAHTPIPLTGIVPGTYFLAASAAPSDATGACGTIAMTTNGYIPVELQSFNIE